MCILNGFYMGPINKTPIKNILKDTLKKYLLWCLLKR